MRGLGVLRANERFLQQDKSFWAHVRTISQQVGYTLRGSKASEKEEEKSTAVKVPTLAEVLAAFKKIGLTTGHIAPSEDTLTVFGDTLFAYFKYRAYILNTFVQSHLMSLDQAQQVYIDLHNRLSPKRPTPMNKQKGDKKAPAYFTGIINMLVEANAEGLPCDYDPRVLTTVTNNNMPLRTLARRLDGAFTSTVNPIAVWEIKEYYYTTTFGSRVADGVYETLLDGLEIEELRTVGHSGIRHYLMIDYYRTWWQMGRSYLCRIIDMLHMGYVDEVLFVSEVIESLPILVQEWVEIARQHPELVSTKGID